ncbi:MAG: hypothetical protein CUN56_07390 [Phototrophicales bacterium]|nr:MAG: hypothetical protein CUN56_07390 [Phototrophicales bacterium]RMG73222.1 MAG: hypothetical protein D6711_11325 [Chloroflexota bacterium]
MTYYVHAQDWRTVELLPEENYEAVIEWFKHDDPGQMIIHPYRISGLNIPRSRLDQIFKDILPRDDDLMTGYAREPMPVENGFAYYDPDFGAIYGTTDENGILTLLCFDCQYCDCGKDFSAAMKAISTIATEFRLFMVDWLLEQVVDIRPDDALQKYFDGM